jgi:hypothetical protein|nr:hypothetical protein [uncultured Rhodoferax sp.]
MSLRLLPLALTLLLAGCDLQALLADPRVAQREADAKAIGSACRHGLRSIEDCYAMNEKASKAAVFTGWKDMDQYMRDNKIEGVAPTGIKPASATDEEGVITETKDAEAKDPKAKTKTAKAGGEKSSAH